MLFPDYIDKTQRLLQFQRHPKPGIVVVVIRNSPKEPPIEFTLHLATARQLSVELDHVLKTAEDKLTQYREHLDAS